MANHTFRLYIFFILFFIAFFVYFYSTQERLSGQILQITLRVLPLQRSWLFITGLCFKIFKRVQSFKPLNKKLFLSFISWEDGFFLPIGWFTFIWFGAHAQAFFLTLMTGSNRPLNIRCQVGAIFGDRFVRKEYGLRAILPRIKGFETFLFWATEKFEL